MDRTALVPVGDVDLEVEVMGSGEPVVVIQTALTADELRLLSQQTAQSGEYQVFHYHRRGYAGSGPAVRQGSVTAEAADAGALIRAMDVAPAHVVGVSYSAAVGLTLASSAPELVQTLAVVEPPPVGTPGASEFRTANMQLLTSHRALGPQIGLDQFMTMLVGRDWREVSERDLPGRSRRWIATPPRSSDRTSRRFCPGGSGPRRRRASGARCCTSEAARAPSGSPSARTHPAPAPASG